MRIIRRAEHRRMPWKNGRGVTEEVASFPAESGMDDFDWRLSIAHVGADGPFSVFPGIDRTITLLDGRGLALDLPEGRTVELTPGGSPFAFPGDWEISSRNLGGPTIDLNIMTRRGRCRHNVRRLTLSPGEMLATAGFGWAVFNMPATLVADGHVLTVERFDAISFATADSFTSTTGHPVEVLFTTFNPAE